mgnify:CR=1 FL=1
MKKSGKVLKFIRYGIGEVFLLIVGILIALSINNWNDARKDKKKLDDILTLVQKDLEANVQEAEVLLKRYADELGQMRVVLSDTTTGDVRFQKPEIFSMNTGFSDLVLRDRGFNLLKQYTMSHEVTDDSLIMELDAFCTQMERYNKLMSDMLATDAMETLRYYRDNMKWFSLYAQGNITREIAEDIFNDQTTQNRLLHYKILIEGNYLRLLSSFAEQGQLLTSKLKNWS